MAAKRPNLYELIIASIRRVSPPLADFLSRPLDWTIERLERTIFLGLRFAVLDRFVSPLGFLGMLTGVVFLILGITGALLMLYYQPALTAEENIAWESVRRINDEVAFGFMLRNIHYHASNAMVILAIMHLFYQLFSGRYKLKYEMIWITGVILGVLTVLEAYTGYNLIVNERAVLAINIGAAINVFTPVLGGTLYQMFVGEGASDLIIRFYALHVFILPLAMILLIALHFPRNLVVDIPVISMLVGFIILLGGLFPVELGIKFVPTRSAGISFPEWYFTSLYAFLRTGIPGFIAAAGLPAAWIFLFLIVPFLDTGKSVKVKDRPLTTAFGITSLIQIILTTFWGFRAGNLFEPLLTYDQLFIDPVIFWGIMLIITTATYAGVLIWAGWLKIGPIKAHNPAEARKPPSPKPRITYYLTIAQVKGIIAALVAFQLLMNILIFHAIATGLKNMVLVEAGLIFMAFGVMVHVYRAGKYIMRG